MNGTAKKKDSSRNTKLDPAKSLYLKRVRDH